MHQFICYYFQIAVKYLETDMEIYQRHGSPNGDTSGHIVRSLLKQIRGSCADRELRPFNQTLLK